MQSQVLFADLFPDFVPPVFPEDANRRCFSTLFKAVVNLLREVATAWRMMHCIVPDGLGARIDSYLMLRSSASGPEIGRPGWI